MRFPFHVDTDIDDEQEEPTLKLDLAIERLKAAQERHEHTQARVCSEHPPVVCDGSPDYDYDRVLGAYFERVPA